MKDRKKLSISQNAFYNTLGTIVFCFCQWITSALLVVHLSPENISVSNTGMLQLAISITNIFFAVSCYNMRTYQISDINNEYTNGEYIGTRFITAGISVILCIVYTVILGYSVKNIFCIAFYMIFKLNETFSDVLHGIDQKNCRMDYVGISYCLRGVLSALSFAIVMILTGNVIVSVAVMAAVSLLTVLIYDVRCTRNFGSVRPVFNKKSVISLLIICLPAVIASSSFTAITTVPRQMLEGMQGEEALGYYGTIATPLIVVQVMATSIFNPMLTELAVDYSCGRIKKFLLRLAQNLLILACITAFIYICVPLFGEFAVRLVFGERFAPYTNLMYGIIGCTSIYTVSWLCTNVLVILRRMKTCMVASITALAAAAICSHPFILYFDMNGVSFTVIFAYIIHIIICCTVIAKNLKGKEKN